MRHVRSHVELRLAGTGEDFEKFTGRSAGDPRIRFLGRLDDAQCIEQYAGALAVPFVPLREDYGYVTLEAFHSGKPVITCTDSGTPADFVGRANAGFVVEPSPQAIAASIDQLYADKHTSQEMGERGRQSIASITWANAAARIVEHAEAKLFV
jgi:glycosyltransferase involved in cell wall biosynthesis